MKILFLEIDTEKTWTVASIGPAYLGAYLRKNGHEANMLRIPSNQSAGEFVSNIKNLEPDILGLSLTSRQWLRARKITQEIRKVLNIPVIAGGLQATYDPKTVLETEGIDCICLGEGEEALLDVMNHLKEHPHSVRPFKNIWVKGNPRPELRPPFELLDDLPFMDHDFLDEQDGIIHMVTQRGCPFPCTYCAASNTLELYKGQEFGRRRSVNNVIEELIKLRQKGSFNYVIFLDDTFTLNPDWVAEFCDFYGREIGVGFTIHARVETISENMLKQLAGAGCHYIIYGVESGSFRVRREIMKRPVKNERFVETFRWTQDANIGIIANYILGLPGEKPADIEETLALNKILKPNDFSYSVFYPFPGTSLFSICLEQGYLPENFQDLPANHRQSILKLPDLTKDQIAYYYDRFTLARQNNYLHQYGGFFSKEQKGNLSNHMVKAATVS